MACVANTDGTSGIEFALILPSLVLLVVGAIDFGQLAWSSMEVNAAAHAGALYALRNDSNAAGYLTAIQTAVGAATPLTVSASPATQIITACVAGGAIVATVQSTCSGGAKPGSYVQVNARATFTPMIQFSQLTQPSTLTAQAMVRVK